MERTMCEIPAGGMIQVGRRVRVARRSGAAAPPVGMGFRVERIKGAVLGDGTCGARGGCGLICVEEVEIDDGLCIPAPWAADPPAPSWPPGCCWWDGPPFSQSSECCPVSPAVPCDVRTFLTFMQLSIIAEAMLPYDRRALASDLDDAIAALRGYLSPGDEDRIRASLAHRSRA